MTRSAKKIVVAGDVAIDWLQWVTPALGDTQDTGRIPNWRLYPGTQMAALPGGACLLANMLRKAPDIQVVSPVLRAINNIPARTVLHSISVLDAFPAKPDDKKPSRFRVKNYAGFTGATERSIPPRPIVGDVRHADVIVLDDAGNGFRDAENTWSDALALNPGVPLILKMSRPLLEGKLWERLSNDTAGRDHRVIVLNADHLREHGMHISRRLSWERTALDCVRQLHYHKAGQALAKCGQLLIRFGLEAVVHVAHEGNALVTRCYYDPQQVEDGYADAKRGKMQGLASAFTAALAAHVAHAGIEDMGQGIRAGMRCARRLFDLGFGPSGKIPAYPLTELFTAGAEEHIAEITLPPPTAFTQEQWEGWTIFGQLNATCIEAMAYEMITGKPGERQGGGWCDVPLVQFGGLRVIDRSEIESYQSIRNLIQEYLEIETPKRPLSIAVFGPPGSGKSFGVTELANSIAGDRVERVEFNVSQFDSLRDLVAAFHRVRDIRLKGKIPLVFFDEFDSAFEGELGWLKYFLAPMQDGVFKDGESTHPIGKAIFVFAGGTKFTFQEFYPEEKTSTTKDDDPKSPMARFRGAKGPDFVSRLRGYINIIGPNPRNDADTFYLIRRAMTLAYNLKERAPHIWDNKKACRIDPGVLRALIKIPRYKHGVRSMLAILDMSMLSGRRIFDQSALPPREQLELHVDADLFYRLVQHDVLFGAALDKLAKVIHENYLTSLPKPSKTAESIKPSHLPWDQLDEFYKESNRRQADHYATKLFAVGCGICPLVGTPVHVDFTPAEIETMAILEHQRWMQEKLAAGWVYGQTEDGKKMQHPSLVEWGDRLPDAEKQKDIDAVTKTPAVLEQAGFTVYRLP